MDEKEFFEWLDDIEDKLTTEDQMPDEMFENIKFKVHDRISTEKQYSDEEKKFFEWLDEIEDTPIEAEGMPDEMYSNIISRVHSRIKADKNRYKYSAFKRVAIIIICIGLVGGISTVTYAALTGRLDGLLGLSMHETLDYTESVSEEPIHPLIKWEDKLIDSKIVTESSFNDLSFFTSAADCIMHHTDGSYIHQGFIFNSYNLAILTKEDLSGWILKKGDILEVSFEIDPDYAGGTGDGEVIGLGYVENGIYHDYEDKKETSFLFKLIAKEDGEYYPTIENFSLSYVKILNVEIKVVTSQKNE